MKPDSLNISLRRTTVDDAGHLDLWRNQLTTLEFQASPRRSLDEVRAMLNEQIAVDLGPETSGRISWMILVNGEPAGNIQLTINGDYDRRLNNAALGYMVSESFQGRGVATAGLRELLKIAFDRNGLALERIEAVAAVENTASRRVLEKCGFRFEGIRRKVLIIRGERLDHAMYSRLATD